MRKSLLQFAYMGAIALVGSVCFSACSDDVNDPGSSSKVNEVSTTDIGGVPVNLVLNVATNAGSADTRMSAANTQATTTQTFRGISEAYIIAYQLPTDGGWVFNPGTGATQQQYKKMFEPFNSLISAGGINASDSRRVLELTMPSGTNTILFYGSAPKTGTNAEQGAVKYNHTTDVGAMSMEYVQRISSTTLTKFYQVGDVIAGIFTALADMGFKNSSLDTDDKEMYFWYNGLNDIQRIADNSNELLEIYKSPKRTSTTTTPIKYVALSTTTGQKEPNGTGSEADANYDTYVTTKTVDIDGVGTKTYTLYHAPVTWKQYGMWVTYNKTATPETKIGLSPLGEKLGTAYNSFVTIVGNELRAASSSAVLYTVKDLYSVVNSVANASPTSIKEWVSVQFATNLKNRMKIYFDFDTSTGDASWNTNFSTALNTLHTYSVAAGNEIVVDGLVIGDFTDFPNNAQFGIPPGGSLLGFTYNYGGTIGDKTTDINYGGLFSFLKDIPNYDLGGTEYSGTSGSTVTVENYVYPAELMYFGNSPVRVSNKELTTNGYPTGAGNWADNTKWSSSDGWGGSAGHVTSDTKSVAMMHNINYGVAMLETKVKISPNGSGYIEDNTAALTGDAENKHLAIAAGTSYFDLTGIIIGTQPRKIGWNFTAPVLSEMDAVANWDRLVYDGEIISPRVEAYTTTTAPDVASYTLLFDNYMRGWTTSGFGTGAQTDQNSVYVALELVNNTGQNFMGKHNMVRKGGTFYLIGKLNPNSNKTGYSPTAPLARSNGDYAMPPYKADDGSLVSINRVFMQDYMTKVTFTIGDKSLQNAYVTVPNLSASQVSLGLSVDINWETGINFGDVVLGDYTY